MYELNESLTGLVGPFWQRGQAKAKLFPLVPINVHRLGVIAEQTPTAYTRQPTLIFTPCVSFAGVGRHTIHDANWHVNMMCVYCDDVSCAENVDRASKRDKLPAMASLLQACLHGHNVH
jgi:hypothetical protein